MTREIYEQCLRENRPYFGGYLAAVQGSTTRHAYMRYLIACECQNRTTPLRILEIGSWAGGSAITWAHALQEFNGGNGIVVCVDPWQPYEITQHITGQVMLAALQNGQIFDLFLHNIRAAGIADIVKPMRGPSREMLTDSLGRFDVIFVDGSHAYDDVTIDLKLAVPLLNERGVLCGDDLELQAHEVNVDFMRANCAADYVCDPKTGIDYHPGVTRAVGECLGPVNCWHGFWATRRVAPSWSLVELYEIPGIELRIPTHLAKIE